MALHTHPPPFGNSVEAVSPTQTLKIGSWDHLEQMQTVMWTFVQVTFAPATFVNTGNISTVTDPILTKLFEPNFTGLNVFKLKHYLD